MYRIDEIKGLLGPLDYLPLMQKDDDGVVVRYPRPLLTKPKLPRLLEAYTIQRGPESGLFYNSTFFPQEKFVKMPEYAIRLFLMSDVIACCGKIPVNEELITFVDEAGNVRADIEEIVSPPSTREEHMREAELTQIIMRARQDNFSEQYEEIAKNHGVHEGYQLVKMFFDPTGG